MLGTDLSRLTEGVSQEETCSRERRTISEPVDTSARQPACLLPVQQACVAGTVSQHVSKRSWGQRGDRDLPCFRASKATGRPWRLWPSALNEAGAMCRLTLFLVLHHACSLHLSIVGSDFIARERLSTLNAIAFPTWSLSIYLDLYFQCFLPTEVAWCRCFLFLGLFCLWISFIRMEKLSRQGFCLLISESPKPRAVSSI